MGAWTSQQASPSPSTSSNTSTSTSSSGNSGTSLRFSRTRYRRPSVASSGSSSSKQPSSPIETVENPPDPSSKDGSTPSEDQFAHSMNLKHREEFYHKLYRTRLPSGHWLSNEIPFEHVVKNIPIVGYVNEYDQPIPSLAGPDIQLTQATMEAITRIGEKNDQNAMLDLPQVFHLTGPRKGQLNDAYAWIALRGNDGDKFVMSRRARNRLVPNWRDLVKDWEEFGECIPDPCDDLRQAVRRASFAADFAVAMYAVQRGISFIDATVEDIMESQNINRGLAKELIESAQDLCIAADFLNDLSEKFQSIVDKVDM